RKRRLFSCACCRRVWHALDEEGRSAVLVVEGYADGEVDAGQLAEVHAAALAVGYAWADGEYASLQDEARAEVIAASRDEMLEAYVWSMEIGVGTPFRDRSWEPCAETLARLCLLRELIGNPFRRVPIDRAWRTPTASALAQSIYNEHAFDRLPILA